MSGVGYVREMIQSCGDAGSSLEVIFTFGSSSVCVVVAVLLLVGTAKLFFRGMKVLFPGKVFPPACFNKDRLKNKMQLYLK